MGDRPSKRICLGPSEESQLYSRPQGHAYGNIEATGSASVHNGDNLTVENHYHYPNNSLRGTNNNDQDQYNALVKSLLFPRMNARVNNVRKAFQDTCTWLFKHKHFKEWHSERNILEHNGFLWIKGKPGCGKSTIMKTALDWAQRQARKKSSNRKVIHYFFNGRAPGILEKSTLGLYRSLVYQILNLYPCFQAYFTAKFALKSPGSPDDVWTINELQDFLLEISHLNEICEMYVLIDALDEGEEHTDVKDMIEFLINLSELTLTESSKFNLRICLSSRHYPYITIKKGLSLVVETQTEHSRDIETYVRKKFLNSDTQNTPDDLILEELAKDICQKSSSIFLWVVLVTRMLQDIKDRGGPPSEMRALLDTIPSDLNDLFERILMSSTHGVEACIALLQWVLFTERALGPDELFVAIQYSLSPADPGWKPPRDMTVPPKARLLLYILDCSRGLVELTVAEPPVVQFIHETVRDYLLLPNGLPSLLPALSTNLAGLSHEILKTSCTRCIASSQVSNDVAKYESESHRTKLALADFKRKFLGAMPFIDYAATHVFRHADKAQQYGVSQEHFLKARSSSIGCWIGPEKRWWNILERCKTRKYSSESTLVYFLVQQELLSILERALKLSPSVNKIIDKCGTALSAACALGNERLVRILISHGADVNIAGKGSYQPLLISLDSQKYHLIPILQSYGAHVAHYGDLHSRLQKVIGHGHLHGVQLLLDMGADPDWDLSSTETVITYTMALAYSGRNLGDQRFLSIHKLSSQVKHPVLKKILHLLLQSRKHQSSEADLSCTVLSDCDDEVVQVLVDNNVSVRENSGLYGIALIVAVYEENLNRARQLVEAGANVDLSFHSPYSNVRNAFYVACQRGSFLIAKLLIERGAGLGGDGNPCFEDQLLAACVASRKDILQLLIEQGTNTGTQQKIRNAALVAACRSSHDHLVKWLLENGADVNAKNSYGQTALSAACGVHRGSADSIVRMLFDRGLTVHDKNGLYDDILITACRDSSCEVVKMLITQGAGVNAEEISYGSSPLFIACGYGRYEVVKALIKEGACIDVKGVGHLNILRAASGGFFRNEEIERYKIVKLLLESTADNPFQSQVLSEALREAKSWEFKSIVKLLLDAGVQD